jgi:hypothetical protein
VGAFSRFLSDGPLPRAGYSAADEGVRRIEA